MPPRGLVTSVMRSARSLDVPDTAASWFAPHSRSGLPSPSKSPIWTKSQQNPEIHVAAGASEVPVHLRTLNPAPPVPIPPQTISAAPSPSTSAPKA